MMIEFTARRAITRQESVPASKASPWMITVVQRFFDKDNEYGGRTASSSVDLLLNKIVAADVLPV